MFNNRVMLVLILLTSLACQKSNQILPANLTNEQASVDLANDRSGDNANLASLAFDSTSLALSKNLNFIAADKTSCESDIFNKLKVKASCYMGGGCTINGEIPSTNNPSANPNLYGACILANYTDSAVIASQFSPESIGFNFINPDKQSCEASVLETLQFNTTCTVGGGCTLNGTIPDESHPSANPGSWGACIYAEFTTSKAPSNLGLNIHCPTAVTIGESVTCSASIDGVSTGDWYVNGQVQAACHDMTACTWDHVPQGNYVVYALGKDASGANTVRSNSVVVVASTSASLSISCPTSVTAGGTASCSATPVNVVSGDWYINGKVYPACQNQNTCAWKNIPAGTYSVQAVGLDSLGQLVKSNVLSVVVNAEESTQTSSPSPTSSFGGLPIPSLPTTTQSKTPGTLSISCPATTLIAGSSATCSAVTTNMLTQDWYVNGSIVVSCRNQLSCTWNNIPSGIYKVQAVGLDNQNNTIRSNIIEVKVQGSLSISCPSSVKAGSAATCSATAVDMASGDWYVNGSVVAACHNQTSCSWQNIPAGAYSIQAKGLDSKNQAIWSNTVRVTAN